MCGLFVMLTSRRVDASHVRDAAAKACERMALRGPDAHGIWQGEGVTLGHRRLAIIDLDVRSNQPMSSADGRYVIVFNGELYNFRELRALRELAGDRFHTASDTEVLLALFAAEGDAMLSRLRGMFALAIWDTQTRELFVARDPYGIKPLYYTRTRDGMMFASQVKALLASGLVSAERELAGVAGFYIWGSVPEPWTFYRGVFALPAGHWMRVRDGKADAPVCWNDIRQHWRGKGAQMSPAELHELAKQAVTDSVRAHLVADVPVSVFLSGGIDSAVVAGLAAELGARVEGITIGFEEFVGRDVDEVPVAAAIAAHYGLRHSVRMVSRAEFEQDVPLIVDAMDQPSIDGVNTWFASKAVAERGYKVVLSGVGGDELFGGYSSFRTIPRVASLGRLIRSIPGVRKMLGLPCTLAANLSSQPKFAGIPAFIGSVEGVYFLNRCLFLPEELPALMGATAAREGLTRLGGTPPGMLLADARDETLAVGLLDSTHYLRNQVLRDSDWASMGHSLELRTPLVDAVLLAELGPYMSNFTARGGKKMLALSVGKTLPDSIMNRSKTGFSTPIAGWLTNMAAQRNWTDLPRLKDPRTPWARRWARIVIEDFL